MASIACFLDHHTAAIRTCSSSSSTTRRYAPPVKPSQLVCRSVQKQAAADGGSAAVVSRRLATIVLIGAAAVGSKLKLVLCKNAFYNAPQSNIYKPMYTSYNHLVNVELECDKTANIFGKPKTNTDFKPYIGDGFKVSIPSKWNPSKEREFPGQVLRYEDNFNATSNLSVMITPTDKKSITDYGSPEDFLSQVDYLLGKQSYFGKTDSEGGFDSGATANILETSTPVVEGKQYYFLSVLTRTADGDEGGKHQLITATVKDGKLYICKAQAGDKRWFKGAKKFVESAITSFSVA
ncbi:hypothetical protein ABFS82_13G011100 [Erythranthe guttata]|uniref:23 kDa subunit of oxygen evolving system of photosystem II n=1 Tax=Erythranthe guttata TaxID=4155 RepID=A0A022RS91_ERYGU|nr:hypothetical protein MIMGU_mgv1a011103mg [Erythranthe guttata]